MFSAQDLAQLESHGVPEAEARRQLQLLANPPAAMKLVRPCTVGDGVLRLDAAAQTEAERLGAELLGKARAARFVPASGAATRMFKELLAAVEAPGDAPPAPIAKLLAEAARF